jgi:hypothetical protein
MGDDELGALLGAASALDRATTDASVSPSPDFADRVMAALVAEPVPSTTGFLAPLGRLGFVAGFAVSIRQARAAMGTGRPMLTRAAALAYVLAVAIAGTSLLGATTVGVAGALGILGPQAPSPTPTIALPSPSPDAVPSPTPSLAPSPEATSEPAGSESPDASDDHGGGSAPEPSDDHSGSSGESGTSGSDGGSGSSDGSATPRPTDTPRPTGTVKPSETPH